MVLSLSAAKAASILHALGQAIYTNYSTPPSRKADLLQQAQAKTTNLGRLDT
jgi:hypothetical protein